MAQVGSLTTLTDGTTAEVAPINSNFDDLKTAVNTIENDQMGTKAVKATNLYGETSGQIYSTDSSNAVTCKDFFNAFANSATNDSLGILQGCWLKRSDDDTLSVSAGCIQIDKKLYFNTSASTVDAADTATATYSVDGTSGVDTGITITASNWYYVYLTTRTDDTDNYLILISDSSPTDRTLGTNCRCIGRVYYDSDGDLQMVFNYRPEGVHGWNWKVGNDTAELSSTAQPFGVTFTRAPYLTGSLIGGVSSGTNPVDTSSFTGNTFCTAEFPAPTTTTFATYIWMVNAGNIVSSTNFGWTFFAAGDWNL